MRQDQWPASSRNATHEPAAAHAIDQVCRDCSSGVPRCHSGACPCQVKQASPVRAHPSVLLSPRLGCHLSPTKPIRYFTDPSTRAADLDLLRLDLCRVYRFQTATPCPISSQRRVKSAFYEQCGVQEVGSANRKWSVSDLLAVLFLLCPKGLMRAGVVQSNGRWIEL